MRVLIAHSQYRWQGGEETTVRNQKMALEARGHEVKLHIVENPSNRLASLGALAVASFNPMEYRSARRAIREQEPDVVHVHNTWFQLSPAVFKASADEGVPSVVTIQNYRLACPQGQFFRNGGPCTDCLGRFPWPGVRHSCYRGSSPLSLWNGLTSTATKSLGLLDSVSAFIVPSEFGREMLVRSGLPEPKSHVVPNAVPDPGARTGLPSKSRTLAFVGRLSAEKGIEELIATFSASSLDLDLDLVVIGDGPLRPRLAEQASDRIEFRGWMNHDEVSRILRSARALVFPSRWYEVCPLVILEAFAAGLPVMASNLGSLRELVGPIDEELLVEPGEWSMALASLAKRTDIDELGHRTRSKYETAYTLERHADRLEHLYSSTSI